MQLRLFVVVVVAVAVCDGRATSLSKSRATQQSSPNGSGPSSTHAGQTSAPSGGLAPTGPELNYTFDPCYGGPCLKFKDITHSYLTYFERHIDAARWIKGKKKPFNSSLTDTDHFKELKEYSAMDKTMKWASPAVMKFEAPAHEFRQIKTVINEHRNSIRNAYEKARRASVVGDNRAYFAAMTEFERLQNTGDPLLMEAAKNYSKIVSVTIANYLNGIYQKNISNPTTPFTDPPANPNFTIMTQPEMKVFIRGFGGTVEGCFKALFELSLFINRNDVSAFYCANYANGILEAWLPVNPHDKFFV